MTSRNDPNYKSALDKAEETWTPAVGLTDQATNSNLAKQNNTIIELLVSISLKLDNLLAQSNNKAELADITAKLANLKLGAQTTGETVKKEPNQLAVWKDPRKQIEEFRTKLKK